MANTPPRHINASNTSVVEPEGVSADLTTGRLKAVGAEVDPAGSTIIEGIEAAVEPVAETVSAVGIRFALDRERHTSTGSALDSVLGQVGTIYGNQVAKLKYSVERSANPDRHAQSIIAAAQAGDTQFTVLTEKEIQLCITRLVKQNPLQLVIDTRTAGIFENILEKCRDYICKAEGPRSEYGISLWNLPRNVNPVQISQKLNNLQRVLIKRNPALSESDRLTPREIELLSGSINGEPHELEEALVRFCNIAKPTWVIPQGFQHPYVIEAPGSTLIYEEDSIQSILAGLCGDTVEFINGPNVGLNAQTIVQRVKNFAKAGKRVKKLKELDPDDPDHAFLVSETDQHMRKFALWYSPGSMGIEVGDENYIDLMMEILDYQMDNPLEGHKLVEAAYSAIPGIEQQIEMHPSEVYASVATYLYESGKTLYLTRMIKFLVLHADDTRYARFDMTGALNQIWGSIDDPAVQSAINHYQFIHGENGEVGRVDVPAVEGKIQGLLEGVNCKRTLRETLLGDRIPLDWETRAAYTQLIFYYEEAYANANFNEGTPWSEEAEAKLREGIRTTIDEDIDSGALIAKVERAHLLNLGTDVARTLVNADPEDDYRTLRLLKQAEVYRRARGAYPEAAAMLKSEHKKLDELRDFEMLLEECKFEQKENENERNRLRTERSEARKRREHDEIDETELESVLEHVRSEIKRLKAEFGELVKKQEGLEAGIVGEGRRGKTGIALMVHNTTKTHPNPVVNRDRFEMIGNMLAARMNRAYFEAKPVDSPVDVNDLAAKAADVRTLEEMLTDDFVIGSSDLFIHEALEELGLEAIRKCATSGTCNRVIGKGAIGSKLVSSLEEKSERTRQVHGPRLRKITRHISPTKTSLLAKQIDTFLNPEEMEGYLNWVANNVHPTAGREQLNQAKQLLELIAYLLQRVDESTVKKAIKKLTTAIEKMIDRRDIIEARRQFDKVFEPLARYIVALVAENHRLARMLNTMLEKAESDPGFVDSFKEAIGRQDTTLFEEFWTMKSKLKTDSNGNVVMTTDGIGQEVAETYPVPDMTPTKQDALIWKLLPRANQERLRGIMKTVYELVRECVYTIDPPAQVPRFEGEKVTDIVEVQVGVAKLVQEHILTVTDPKLEKVQIARKSAEALNSALEDLEAESVGSNGITCITPDDVVQLAHIVAEISGQDAGQTRLTYQIPHTTRTNEFMGFRWAS